MHLSKALIRLLLLLTAMLVLNTPAFCKESDKNAQLKDEILTGIEQKYAHKSFSADFNQAARLAALDLTETATGQAWFSHPGRMRWLYLTPDRHEIITNGKELWIYRPDEEQVMIGDAAPFFQAGAGGAFLSDITRIKTDFTIELGKADDSYAQLILTPKKESPDLAVIRITIARASHQIEMVVTENIYGDSTRFIFSNIRFNDPDPAMFNFTIPDGTSVIEMN